MADAVSTTAGSAVERGLRSGPELPKRCRRLAVAVGLALAAAAAPALAAWQPDQDELLDIQLTSPFNLVRPVDAIALDLFETSPARLQELKSRGVRTICVIDAGAWENWRPDSHAYDLRVVGGNRAGWQNERWVDIRAADTIRPILAKRLDLCRSKGFDGVAFDKVDGYAHRTGFPLTARDQLTFNRWLADEARVRGLAAGLVDTLELVPELVEDFDFAISYSCFSDQSCERLLPFQKAGKPVFAVEFTNVRRKMDTYCGAAQELGIQLLFKAQSLNGKVHRRCP
jgi:endo-alpha-1,4-polygalactosaminidase (GH114 family)